jgi:hypothetical protein
MMKNKILYMFQGQLCHGLWRRRSQSRKRIPPGSHEEEEGKGVCHVFRVAMPHHRSGIFLLFGSEI